MTQLNYPKSLCQSMCLCGAYLLCRSRANCFPSVSWYQHSENLKSHGTFFFSHMAINARFPFYCHSSLFQLYGCPSVSPSLLNRCCMDKCFLAYDSVLSSTYSCVCWGLFANGWVAVSQVWWRGRGLSLLQPPSQASKATLGSQFMLTVALEHLGGVCNSVEQASG